MAKKKEESEFEVTERDAPEAGQGIDARESIVALRDAIAGIEAYVELIPKYYQNPIAKARLRGHHTPNERAKCFREATLLDLARARGWLTSEGPRPARAPPFSAVPNDTTEAIELAIARINYALGHLATVPVGEDSETTASAYLARFELGRARLALGEELGILGGY